jgi:hypothetical protein
MAVFSALPFRRFRSRIPVEAVVRGVQLAVGEPFVERRVRLVEGGGERFLPVEVFAREAGPEALVVALRFLAQLVIGIHPGDGGVCREPGRRREHAVLLQAMVFLVGLVLGHASLQK